MKSKKLSTIMVIWFIGIHAFFLMGISAVSYRIYSQVIFSETSSARQALLNESVTRMTNYVSGISDSALMLVSNEAVMNALSGEPDSLFDSLTRQKDISAALNRAISFKRYIQSIQIYTDRFEHYGLSGDGTILPLEAAKQTEWYPLLEQSDSGWIPRHTENMGAGEVISYVQWIFNNKGKPVGFVKINVAASSFEQALRNNEASNDGMLLLDFAGRIVAFTRPDKDLALFDLFSEQGPHPLDRMVSKPFDSWSSHSEVIRHEGKSYLVIASVVQSDSWRVTLILSEDTLLEKTKKVRTYAIWLGVFFLLLSIPAAMGFAHLMTSPIKKLIGGMKQVERGDFSARLRPYYAEEYTVLTERFNRMVSQLDELMNRLGREQRRKLEAEMKALQSQIKPHFLYNTLDLIYWRSLDYKADDIGRMIQQLGKLFRIGLSGGHTFICVRDELEHARCYMQIQKARLKRPLEYLEDVPLEMMGYWVPKIILQPFIENSMMHGYSNAFTGTVVIQIRIRRTQTFSGNDAIELVVRDNGKGFPAVASDGAASGIGIKNVHDRIRLFCGDGYGVSIGNHEEGGARVTITLPLIEHNPNPDPADSQEP